MKLEAIKRPLCLSLTTTHKWSISWSLINNINQCDSVWAWHCCARVWWQPWWGSRRCWWQVKDLKTGSGAGCIPLNIWNKFTSTSSGEEDEEDPDPLVEGEILAHTTRSTWLGRDYCENCTYLFSASMLRCCYMYVELLWSVGCFFSQLDYTCWTSERSAKTKSKLVMMLIHMKLVMIKILLE